MSKPSLFQEVKRFINIRAIGSTYESRELCNYTRGTEEVTWWKARCNNESYRTRTYQTYLKRLGFLKNVRRGVWQIVAHVPEWLDSGHVNCALGYTYGNWDPIDKCWSRPAYKGASPQNIKERINIAIMAQQPSLVEDSVTDKTSDGDLATFLHNDPLTACIELRRMGVLAVPSDKNEIELHIIDKRAAETLAHWMIHNNYELNDYPMLEDLLRVYWPKPEVVEEDIEENRPTVTLAVLHFCGEVKVEIIQGVYADSAEQFIQDNYNEDSIQWMVMRELKLEIKQAY